MRLISNFIFLVLYAENDSPACDSNELELPQNAERWSCSKQYLNLVRKGGKCKIRCKRLFKFEKPVVKWEKTKEKCWDKCGKKGGKCSFCGKSGFCCRKQMHSTWNGDCPIEGMQAALEYRHDCVSPKKGQKRDTHRCTLGGKWAKPDKVQVKCIYDKDAIDALQLNVTRLQSEVSYLQAQSNLGLVTELNVTRLQSEVLHLQEQSIIDAERISHLEKRIQYLDLMKSDTEQLNENINEGLYQIPDRNQVLEVNVRKVEINGTVCRNTNEEWTPWRSVTTGADNDFETLLHHIATYSNSSIPICYYPKHIEAREIETKLSWTDSQSFLVHYSKSKTKEFSTEKLEWSPGISKESGFVCFEQLQFSGRKCKDFEARFCCPKIKQSRRQKQFNELGEPESEPKLPENFVPKITFEELRNDSINLSIFLCDNVFGYKVRKANQIGLECDTGNITDCNDSLATHQNASEIIPNGCEDKLIFGLNRGLCGTFCKQDSDGHVITKRSENKILRSGWTIYASYDNPDGTGDHENYYSKSREIFELDGTKYTQCIKKAVHIRSRSRHEPWYGLSGRYSDLTFLFSKDRNYYTVVPENDWKSVHYTKSLSAEYGIHCFNNYANNNQNCIDMELSYFVECEKKATKTRRDVNNLQCFIASQDGLPNKNVLVLSTKRNLPISSPDNIEYLRTNLPMIISFTGSDEKINFAIDENTEVFNGCSFTLKNEFWVAGGSGNARYQLKKIDNCDLKIMELRLPFGFPRGGCNTFSIQSVEQSWLCFGDMTSKQCYSFNGTSFELQTETLYDHRQVDDLGSYEGRPFVVGSVHNPYHCKTEIYNSTSRNWIEYAEYPFASFYIGQYTIVSSSTAVFILGGKADWGNTSKVARFQNFIWKQIANLKFARHGHRALKYGDLVMIVGGWVTADNAITEIWNEDFTRGKIINPILPNGYYVRHELFLVDSGFCQV